MMKEQQGDGVIDTGSESGNESYDDATGNVSSTSSTRSARKMLLTAAGVAAVVAGSLTTGLVVRKNKLDLQDDVCVEGEIQDLQGATLELTLGGITEPISEANQRILEDAVLKAFNEVSQGCDDPMDRWMVSTTFDHQDVVWDEWSNSSLIVASIDMSISCDDCDANEAFADEYPQFFGELERRLARANPQDQFLKMHAAEHPNRKMTVGNSAVRGVVKPSNSESSTKSGMDTRSLQSALEFLNAADVIVAVQRAAADMGFMEEEEFQSILEAAIVTRTQKLILVNGGKKKNKKMGRARGGRGKKDDKDEGGMFAGVAEGFARMAGLMLDPEQVLEESDDACENAYVFYPGTCNTLAGMLDEVNTYIEASMCPGAPPVDNNIIYGMIATCAVIYEQLPAVQVMPDFFSPVNSRDADYDIAYLQSQSEYNLEENKYAWASDYRDECGMGFVIHSGGTGTLLDEGSTRTAPIITFRDNLGQEIYKDYIYDVPAAFPLLGIGVRAGLLVECSASLMTIVIAQFGNPGELIRMTIDTSADTPFPMIGGHVNVQDYAATEIASPSVRSMHQVGRCYITYAPLNDIVNLQELTVESSVQPLLVTYNWCDSEIVLESRSFADSVAIDFGDRAGGIKGKTLEGAFVWDFECEFGMCWIALVSGIEDEDYPSGVNLSPNLYFFDEAMLNLQTEWTETGEGDAIPMTQVWLDMDVDTSALTLRHIDEDRVLACSLSGWIYQVVADGTYDLDVRRHLAQGKRKLKGDEEDGPGGPLAGPLGVDLKGLELGQAQECNICSASMQYCSRAATPELTSTTAYIWRAVKCGGYMFIGTLDVNSVVGPLVLYEVEDALGINVGAVPAMREWLQSLLTSLVFGSLITPYDKGFDLFYVTLDELVNSEEPAFRPVTLNGFKNDEAAQTADFGPFWPKTYPFGPDTATEDGIRQLTCHDDNYLVVGTAVYTGSQSSSTWILDMNRNVPGTIPEGPPPDFDASVIPETGIGTLLNDPDFASTIVMMANTLFEAIANTVEDGDYEFDEFGGDGVDGVEGGGDDGAPSFNGASVNIADALLP